MLRSTTGVTTVVGVDQRFAQIGDGHQEPEGGITAYADIEDALPRLIEKPMATTTDAARTLVEAAEAAGVVLMPGHTFEHNAAVHKLRDLVRGGHLGRLVLGSRPTTVTVWGSRHVHPEHEDVAYLRLDYGGLGVRSNIHVSWLDPRKVRRVTAVGSKRMVVALAEVARRRSGWPARLDAAFARTSV